VQTLARATILRLPAGTEQEANGGSVADCEGAFTAGVSGGATRLAEDEAKALAGGIPACAGLTRQQITDAYSNATFYLPQAATPPASPSSAPTSSPPSLAGKAVATFSGSGIQNTPKFTVTDTWKLSYSFDCSSFGFKGNFQVYEDGGIDFSGPAGSDPRLNAARLRLPSRT
jgi:hypothetical protein